MTEKEKIFLKSNFNTVGATCGHGARWSEDRMQFGHVVLKDEVEPELLCSTCFMVACDKHRKGRGNLKRVLLHGEWCEV